MRNALSLNKWDTPLLLVVGLVVLTGLSSALGYEQLTFSLTEMLIRLVVVVGIYLFVGNSGVISFGHIGFMCIGAYAAAWLTLDPSWKQVMLSGLPVALQENTYPFGIAVLAAACLAAFTALLLGAALMRLNGLAASIATFAFLAIVNSVYSNWDTVTGGTSSLIGIPNAVTVWIALGFAAAAIIVAFAFQTSRVGLMLRASREDEVAAQASSIGIFKVRLAAFVLSAFVVGAGGALYAQFIGVLTPDAFYLGMAFVTLAMLVVGGVGSLTGAVLGTAAVTLVTEVLKVGERGLTIAGSDVALPLGSQEIGLGIAMMLILILRPAGSMGNEEVRLSRGTK